MQASAVRLRAPRFGGTAFGWRRAAQRPWARFQSEASGMEPPTTRRRNGANKERPKAATLKNGAEDWNRTSDTSIFSAVLYQLSYLGTAPRRWQNPHNTRSKTSRSENTCTRDRVLVLSADRHGRIST